jgi:hypothetical protein
MSESSPCNREPSVNFCLAALSEAKRNFLLKGSATSRMSKLVSLSKTRSFETFKQPRAFIFASKPIDKDHVLP